MTMTIDINTEIYRLEEGKKIKVVIASTLNVDGSPCDDVFDATVLDGTRPTLMDDFEYVVYGRVFKYNRPKVRVCPWRAMLLHCKRRVSPIPVWRAVLRADIFVNVFVSCFQFICCLDTLRAHLPLTPA